MTLILNEIHVVKGLSRTISIAAADSRLTDLKGKPSTAKKLFPIPYFKGAVSFFGLAEFKKGGKGQSISVFLDRFLKTYSWKGTLKDFVSNLKSELGKFVPKELLAKYVSGIHICGYENGRPDFWFICNYEKATNFNYEGFKGYYHRMSSDFLERDAKAEFGWDGVNPANIQPGIMYYRNGDFRAHAVISKHLDDALTKMFSYSDFKQPQTLKDYAKYVKFKLEFIAYLYRQWNRMSIIGTPIRVVASDGSDFIEI